MAFAGAPIRLSFSKLEGLGNDFLVLDLRCVDPLDSVVAQLQSRAAQLCDRRRGVGGDGLLLVCPPSDPQHDAKMIVINADGSRPEMCGNGLRCVAHFLSAALSAEQSRTLLVETDNGPLRCVVKANSATQAQVSVSMGRPQIGSSQRPSAAPEREFWSVSMGNPHAIHWVGENECPETLAKSLGPAIEVDPAYPDRSNVEFVKDTPEALVCWVWERGCGITQACGTGACATAVAAVRAKRRESGTWITVRLPGGDLKIMVGGDAGEEVLMEGPSAWAFDGTLAWDAP